MAKLFILCGEPSGDLHAAKLIPHFKSIEPDTELYAVGGVHLKNAGVTVVKDISDMAFMGFVEVLKNLRAIRKNFQEVKTLITSINPDAIIFIDYPGFNLKIAKFAKERGFRTVYYITPKIWAWNQKRAYKIKRYIDDVIPIFPFEPKFYKQYGIETHYFGHPIVEGLNPKETKEIFLSRFNSTQIIGLMPGSRLSEIRTLLPTLFQYARNQKNAQFALSTLSSIDKKEYQIPSDLMSRVHCVEDDPYSIMSYSSFLIVASGTANLEAACFNTPMIVVYQVSPLTYFLAKRLVKIKHVSPVNIVAEKEIVKELLQDDFSVSRLLVESDKLLKNYDVIKNELKRVSSLLDKTNISHSVANYILKIFSKK